MLSGTLWILGATVLSGLALGCFYLLERPIRGAARLGSWVHGLLGAAGVALVVTAARSGGTVQARVVQTGPGLLAAGLLAGALAGGAAVFVAQMRHRRPPGWLVLLHALGGATGAVLLAGSG